MRYNAGGRRRNDPMLKRTAALALVAALGLMLGACSKCEMSGFLKGCGDATPKARLSPL